MNEKENLPLTSTVIMINNPYNFGDVKKGDKICTKGLIKKITNLKETFSLPDELVIKSSEKLVKTINRNKDGTIMEHIYNLSNSYLSDFNIKTPLKISPKYWNYKHLLKKREN